MKQIKVSSVRAICEIDSLRCILSAYSKLPVCMLHQNPKVKKNIRKFLHTVWILPYSCFVAILRETFNYRINDTFVLLHLYALQSLVRLDKLDHSTMSDNNSLQQILKHGICLRYVWTWFRWVKW